MMSFPVKKSVNEKSVSVIEKALLHTYLSTG